MSEDLIKRSDAIKALNREKSDWNCDYNVPIDNCIKRLNKVKSAGRPQGEWIDVWQDGVCSWRGTCSVCRSTNDIPPPFEANFCPNCGAHMAVKGADDE